MIQERRRRAEIWKRAAQRVEAVWTCLNVLCPDLPLVERKVLATKVLDLCRGEAEPVARINAAQVQEIVWRNLQCVNRHCPMLLFSREIADELNEFFSATE